MLLKFCFVAEVSKSNVDLGCGGKDFSEISLSSSVDIIDTEDVISALKQVHHGNVSSHT